MHTMCGWSMKFWCVEFALCSPPYLTSRWWLPYLKMLQTLNSIWRKGMQECTQTLRHCTRTSRIRIMLTSTQTRPTESTWSPRASKVKKFLWRLMIVLIMRESPSSKRVTPMTRRSSWEATPRTTRSSVWSDFSSSTFSSGSGKDLYSGNPPPHEIRFDEPQMPEYWLLHPLSIFSKTWTQAFWSLPLDTFICGVLKKLGTRSQVKNNIDVLTRHNYQQKWPLSEESWGS